MPTLKRGHRTTTFEILEVVGVDNADLSLTLRHAGSIQPKRLVLNAPACAAAYQLLEAMADSITIATNADGDSRWTAFDTVNKAMWYSGVILREMTSRGVDSFADPAVSVPFLRELYRPLSSSMKRSACWLLARAVQAHHPNGPALGYALKNTRFPAEDHDPFTYDIDVVTGIEKTARRVWTAAYRSQRDLFATIGYDVTGRDWLQIPADDVIEWARRTHPDLTTNPDEPTGRLDTAAQVAWAVTHPEQCGHRKHAKLPSVRSRPLREVGRALYPDSVTLVAALIVHALAEHAGYNLSVLLEKSADALIPIGDNEALEYAVKARSASEERRPTRLDSLYTSGGVVHTLTGLTRFSRHHRRTALSTPGQPPPPLVDRLYVEHVEDPHQAQVLASGRLHNGWRAKEFELAWAQDQGMLPFPPLRMGALRLEAQRRVMNQGLTADVHGHTDAMKTHYLAHVLPDHAFTEHAVAAQNAFHDDAVARFQIVADATEGPAAELAAVDPSQVMDVEIGLCTSGGNAPDSNRRCGLGIVACFTCPNGYRTIEHVPGLLAAVELASIIESHDPEEWANGQASDLKFYAQACLDAFPAPVVTNIRRTTDLAPHILTVTGMYMEMRHG